MSTLHVLIDTDGTSASNFAAKMKPLGYRIVVVRTDNVKTTVPGDAHSKDFEAADAYFTVLAVPNSGHVNTNEL